MKKPADHVTLSADEGEALIARVPRSNLGTEDAGVVELVIRMDGFVAFALPEANLSVKRLQDVCVGRGRKAKTSPEPEASAPLREALDAGEAGGESAPVEEYVSALRRWGVARGQVQRRVRRRPRPCLPLWMQFRRGFSLSR